MGSGAAHRSTPSVCATLLKVFELVIRLADQLVLRVLEEY